MLLLFVTFPLLQLIISVFILWFPSYYQTNVCSSSSILETFGLIDNYCYNDGLYSTKFSWPNFYGYNTSSCSGKAAFTQNVQTKYNCDAVHPVSNNDDAIHEGSYLKYSSVNAATCKSSLNFGIFVSMVLAIMHLWGKW
jgi:hypothetical protein